MRALTTYENHNNAELAFAFLVSSQPSSRPTGRITIEHMPIIAMIAKRPPVLWGFTRNKLLENSNRFRKRHIIPAHINDSQAPARIGIRTFAVKAKWWVNTRSNNGAVAIAATIPDKRRQAPIKPLSSAE